jgi:2-hydroxy-3-keto-5-methylthiopentenyl-1-phosphate phosphatase
MQIFCDFDGTITTVDTTDHVLSRLASPEWEQLEAEWCAGRIDAAACMRGQIALLQGDNAALDAVLDEVELAPGFADFVDWCSLQAISLTIVSDGVDYFIRRVLTRQGVAGVPIVSNRLLGRAGARRLSQPHRREGCAAGAGVCKCQATRRRSSGGPSRPAVIYIGDGRSDFCVSARADLLFTKGDLADYAQRRGQPHHPFSTFHDVLAVLEPLAAARRVAAQ